MRGWAGVLLVLASCGSGGVTDPAHVPAPASQPTINAGISIQPSDTTCAPALCSGGDALVTATVSNAPTSRNLRFSVVSGPIGILAPTDAGTLAFTNSADTITDAQGAASVHIRANAAAPTQPATLQVLDLGTGLFQRASLVVVQTTASSVLVVPSVVTFAGPNTNTCGSASSDVYLFGGSPPYVIGASSSFAISPSVVPASGGSFNVRALGGCGTATVPITDSAGRVTTVTLQNLPGTAVVPPAPVPAPLTVAPLTVTLGNCSTVADVSVVGGTGAYATNSSDRTAVYAQQTGTNTVSIGRNPATTATPKSAVTIQSGNEIATVAVEVVPPLDCP